MTVATFYKAYFVRSVSGGLWKVFMFIKKIFKMWWYKQTVILNNTKDYQYLIVFDNTVGNREINKKCFLSYKKLNRCFYFNL